MSDTIPIVCYVTGKEFQQRRKIYPDKAAESLIDSAELSDGFVNHFPLDDSIGRVESTV